LSHEFLKSLWDPQIRFPTIQFPKSLLKRTRLKSKPQDPFVKIIQKRLVQSVILGIFKPKNNFSWLTSLIFQFTSKTFPDEQEWLSTLSFRSCQEKNLKICK